jgi:hypothetical protein
MYGTLVIRGSGENDLANELDEDDVLGRSCQTRFNIRRT